MALSPRKVAKGSPPSVPDQPSVRGFGPYGRGSDVKTAHRPPSIYMCVYMCVSATVSVSVSVSVRVCVCVSMYIDRQTDR